MNILESEKVILKLIEKVDLAFLMELRQRKEVCEWIVSEPLTAEKQEKWFSELKDNELYFVIISASDGSSEGQIGLFDINRQHQRARWTLRIHPDHWKKGYAKEAMKIFFDYVFNILNLNKISGDCFIENKAEVENLKRAGFKEEGYWEDHYFHKGKFRDAINFAMTKKDYENTFLL